MPIWAGGNPRLVHKHNEAANEWLQANGGLELGGRSLACQRACFPSRKQLGSANVFIVSCCHNPSSITFGLYCSSAASVIFCRFAAGLSCRQRLACLALAVSMALSGLGRNLQSVIPPLTILSLEYVWNQRGRFNNRIKFRIWTAFMVRCRIRFATKCHFSGPERRKCVLSA